MRKVVHNLPCCLWRPLLHFACYGFIKALRLSLMKRTQRASVMNFAELKSEGPEHIKPINSRRPLREILNSLWLKLYVILKYR